MESLTKRVAETDRTKPYRWVSYPAFKALFELSGFYFSF